MSVRSIFVLITSFLFLTLPLRAQTLRYVDLSGDDQGSTNTCSNPGAPCRTVGQAINQASAGDVIQIGAGEFTEALALAKSLTLHGAGQDETIIQAHAGKGQADQRVLTLSGEPEVELADLTIRHGSATSGLSFIQDRSGGGIFIDGGAVKLTRVAITDNESGHRGGGMYSRNASLSFDGVVFRENTANEGGGGLFQDAGTAELEDVEFVNNESTRGAGMYSVGSSPTLSGVTFHANTSSFQGGGLHNDEGSPELTDVTFSDNSGGAAGGMYNRSGSPTLTNVTFINNTSDGISEGVGGGGMSNVAGSPVLIDVVFESNEGDLGGGLSSSEGSLSLSNVTFRQNTGGGLYNFRTSSTLSDVLFTGNTAGSGGGMTNWESDDVSLVRVTFAENASVGTSPTAGGGGMSNRNSHPVLEDVLFEANVAARSGGAMHNVGSSPTLRNVDFIDNTAEHDGGAMYNANESSPSLTDVTFRNNAAVEFGGGGMNNSGNSAPSLVNVVFEDNVAGSTGGGMENRGSGPSLSNVTFEGNRADFGGGGIYNSESTPNLTNVLFIGNSAEERGGGMYSANSSTTLGYVTFSGNSASSGGGLRNGGGSHLLKNVTFTGNSAIVEGGGIQNISTQLTIVNAAFLGNTALGHPLGSGGGGMSNQNSSPQLTNVSFSGNRSDEGGAMFNFLNSSPSLTNVIIWNNAAENGTTEASASIRNDDGGTSNPAITYSLIAHSGGSGGAWVASIGDDGGNNIDADPLFLHTPDPLDAPTFTGNLRLQAGSPAVDVGDPDVDLSLFFVGEVESPVDLGGNPRINDGRIDMGAYEHHEGVTRADSQAGIPETILLHQNYPNPFNPSTVIRYDLAEAGHVELAVFDVLGRKVTTLVDGHRAAGNHLAIFEAGELPSGNYVYRLRMHTAVRSGRMILAR